MLFKINPMSQQKAIIICRSFPPYAPSVGGTIRMETLSNYLKRKNLDVSVITSKGYDFGYMGLEKLLEGINIFYVKDRMKSVRENSYTVSKVKKQKKPSKLFSIVKKIIETLLKELFVPDDGILVVKNYIKTAKKILKKDPTSKFNIITSGPSHSAHLVGYRLKKKYPNRINWIMDYRDSWNCHGIFKKDNLITKQLSIRIEKKCLERADFVSFASSPIKKKIEERFSINLKNKSEIVMNGFQEIPERETQQEEMRIKIKIGHFGWLNTSSHYRRFTYITNALKKLPKDFPFELHQYGHTNLKKTDLEEAPQVKLHGNISNSEAVQKMKEMDYLMILHTFDPGSEDVITGKFFEYVAAQKPILCIGPLKMEVCKLIKEDNLGMCVDYKDTQGLTDLLLKLPEYDNRKVYKKVDIQKYSREYQYNKLYPSHFI